MSWEIYLAGNLIFAEGEVGEHNVDAFCQQLRSCFPAVGFNFRDLEIADGVSMAAMITFIREVSPIEIHYAPQMLAHTLYKIGMLETGNIVLLNPRYDEN